MKAKQKSKKNLGSVCAASVRPYPINLLHPINHGSDNSGSKFPSPIFATFCPFLTRERKNVSVLPVAAEEQSALGCAFKADAQLFRDSKALAIFDRDP